MLAGADYFVRNNVSPFPPRHFENSNSLLLSFSFCLQKGKRARDVAAVPHLRKLFKHFDMCIAAARLYTRHHQPASAAVIAAHAAHAAAVAASEARAQALAHASTAAAEAEHQIHYVPSTHATESELSPIKMSSLQSDSALQRNAPGESAEHVETQAGIMTAGVKAEEEQNRYANNPSTPFSPGSSFPTALPDSPFRARKYVRRGVLSREEPAEGYEYDHQGGSHGDNNNNDDDDDPYHHTLASILDIVHEERGDSTENLAQYAEEDFPSTERLVLAVEESALRIEEVVGAQEKVNESLWAAVHVLQNQYAALAEENKLLKAKQNEVLKATTTHVASENGKSDDTFNAPSFEAEMQLAGLLVVIFLLVYYVLSFQSPQGSSMVNP